MVKLTAARESLTSNSAVKAQYTSYGVRSGSFVHDTVDMPVHR